MLPNIQADVMRPNKVSDAKNMDYHLNFARYYMGSIDRTKYQNFLTRSLVKWAFYKGYQWIFKDDLEPFLMDESGETRNRIRFIENICEPIIRSYVNNAIRISYNYRAEAINPFAVSRRELALQQAIAFQTLAKATGEPYYSFVKDNFNVGDNPGETEQIFEDSFSDDYVNGINYLVKDIISRNDIEDIKVRGAKHMAIDGIFIPKEDEYRGSQRWQVVHPQSFFWDMAAQKPNLSDGEFMGHIQMALPVELYEQHPRMKDPQKQDLERYIQMSRNQNWQFLAQYLQQPEGRVPVVNFEWKDTEKQDWGWVPDITGRPVFLRVNFDGGRFKTSDCVWPEEERLKEELNDDKLMVRYPVIIRYCKFIPKEYVPTKGRKDIVLEWGIVPYTDTEQITIDNSPFTYKPACYEYADGEIFSPLDPVIDPQRLINRINSNAESQINNSRGSGSAIAKESVDPKDGEEEVLRSMNLGKPIFLDTQGIGISNAIGQYNGTSSPNINILFEAKNLYAATIKNNLGINDAMTGTIGGQRELLGVNNSMIERGSLMQEGFYYSLGQNFQQMYQSMIHRGKAIYIFNDTEIYYVAGDKYTKMLKLTKDYLPECFRVYIERTTPETDHKLIASTLALNLLQLGALDQKRFAMVFNRGTEEDVLRMMREYVAEKEAVQKQMAAQQQQMLQQADQQQKQMEQDKANKPVEVAQVNQQGAIAKEMLKLNQQ